jgi:hypothetical protein
MYTLKHRHQKRHFIVAGPEFGEREGYNMLLPGQSLGSVKDISLSSTEHYMDYKVVVIDGMVDLQIVLEK